ncbi:MAG: hypothetical protein Q8R28_15410 [Dehalococcoidia bacterium]|nr:hypothetical protein [Dehalococcoidia bacterium]
MTIREDIAKAVSGAYGYPQKDAMDLASIVEGALISQVSDRSRTGWQDERHPLKFLALRIRDGKLEYIPCPYFVIIAKDTHGLSTIRMYEDYLTGCSAAAHDLDAVTEHVQQFADWEPKKEPD